MLQHWDLGQAGRVARARSIPMDYKVLGCSQPSRLGCSAHPSWEAASAPHRVTLPRRTHGMHAAAGPGQRALGASTPRGRRGCAGFEADVWGVKHKEMASCWVPKALNGAEMSFCTEILFLMVCSCVGFV